MTDTGRILQQEYEARRAENRRQEAIRREEATRRDPLIGALLDQRVEVFSAAAKEAFASPAQAMEISERLSARIKALQADLRARLALSGLPEDYLQPVAQCPDCRDTGFVGEPIQERCHCYLRRQRELNMQSRDNGLNPLETFEAFDANVYQDTLVPGTPYTQRTFMLRLRERCEEYAVKYPGNERCNLAFFGKSGLGKTYLLNCVGNRLRDNGHEVLKITAYQMTERMRAAIFDRDPDAFSALLTVPLLILDDLGAEPVIPNITVEQLFTLLNERAAQGLPLLISSNLAMEQLRERYGDRVFSRLMDTRCTALIQFIGKDVRLA